MATDGNTEDDWNTTRQEKTSQDAILPARLEWLPSRVSQHLTHDESGSWCWADWSNRSLNHASTTCVRRSPSTRP